MSNNITDWSKLQFKTISSLPPFAETNAIKNDDLLEISVASNTDNNITYTSNKIEFGKITTQIVNNLIEHLETEYGLSTDINFTTFKKDLDDYWNAPKKVNNNEIRMATGEHLFEEPPLFEKSLLQDWNNPTFQKRAINLESLIAFSKTENSIYLNNSGSFETRYYSIETQQLEDVSGLENAPSTETEKHNAFIFRIIGNESNTWTCPASGWFTCYGWVDEDNIDLNQPYTRWVSLEGNFGQNGWKILQFTPIISSAFCSYVSFSLPVKEGLELRLKTGFKVGTNSGSYWSQRNSMTNHIANAFVGGIYNGYDFTTNQD